MGAQKKPIKITEDLVQELRQGYGLSASFFRAAAARIEMTDTDMHVIDLLESNGDSTAGQLATLMGLTTGTFTAILNRLEKAGLVRRERDPNDGRRVIVKLATGSDGTQKIGPLFASLGNAWKDMTAEYDDEQKAFLLAFLRRSNALAREEIDRLRGSGVGDEGLVSAPLLNLESARFVFQSEGGVQLNLRAGSLAGALYQARFEGAMPDVKVKEGVVTIRYPKRLWLTGSEIRTAEIILSTAIPWQIAFKGGGAMMTAELGRLDLLGLEANGAGSMFRVDLPVPSRVVPIRMGGFGSEFALQCPQNVAVQIQSKGWGSGVVVDGQTVNGMSNVWQSSNYEDAALRYDIETSGSGSMLTVTTG